LDWLNIAIQSENTLSQRQPTNRSAGVQFLVAFENSPTTPESEVADRCQDK